MSRSGFIAAGNWIVDQVKIIDNYPDQDNLGNILSQSSSNGGSPYTLLVDLKKLGAEFPLEGLGLVGKDDNGTFIKKDCENHGIDSSMIFDTNEASTSYTDVMSVKSTGRRTFFHQRGANAFLDEKHFETLSKSNAKIFHLGYLMLLDKLDVIEKNGRTAASYVLERAVNAGFKVSVDIVSETSDKFKRVVSPSLPYIDYLFVNEYEAGSILGMELAKEGEVLVEDAKKAAKLLIEKGVREWVFLHFPKGTIAANKNGEVFTQGSVKVPSTDVVGASGAGDAFASGVIYALHENYSIENTLKSGVCAAAQSLYASSSSGAIKALDECLFLGRKYGFYEI